MDLVLLCLKKMVPLIDTTNDPQTFLETAATIYEGTPTNDRGFRPYFRECCPAMLVGFEKNYQQRWAVLEKYLRAGGDLAVDIFQAYRAFFKSRKLCKPTLRNFYEITGAPLIPLNLAR